MEDTDIQKESFYLMFAASEVHKSLVKSQELENINVELIVEHAELNEEHNKLKQRFKRVKQENKELQATNDELMRRIKKLTKEKLEDTLASRRIDVSGSNNCRSYSVFYNRKVLDDKMDRSFSTCRSQIVKKVEIPVLNVKRVEMLMESLKTKLSIETDILLSSDHNLRSISAISNLLNALISNRESSVLNNSQPVSTTKHDKSTLETQLLNLLTEYKEDVEIWSKKYEDLDIKNSRLSMKYQELRKFYFRHMQNLRTEMPGRHLCDLLGIELFKSEFDYEVLEKFSFHGEGSGYGSTNQNAI